MSVVGGYIELAAISESEACGKALYGAAICFDEEQQSEIGRWLFAGRSDASGDTVRLKDLY